MEFLKLITLKDKLNLVLKDVQALTWIEKLPNGLDTRVGERGQSLSMGQRQLIAFCKNSFTKSCNFNHG